VFKRRSAYPRAGLPPIQLESVTVLGCHGGAGSTTVRRMLAPVGRERASDEWARRPDPLVLVAKGTAYGMKWATEYVSWAHEALRFNGGVVHAPVLVTVADSPLAEPPTVRARATLLQDQVLGLVRFPYVPEWADRDDPLSAPAPHSTVAAACDLRNLLSSIHQNELGAVRR
jgi:hypothetical protein